VIGLILAAFFTRNMWLPDIGVSPSATPINASTPETISIPLTTAIPVTADPTATEQNSWIHLNGDGYSLDYPPDWFAFQPPATVTDPSGIHYDLILSDSPGNEDAQSATPDEKARLTIWYVPKGQDPMAAWVATNWAWLNTEFVKSTLGNKPVLTASLDASLVSKNYIWYETADWFYVIESYAPVNDLAKQSTLQQILKSITLSGQGG
jgi:hypothetical protein